MKYIIIVLILTFQGIVLSQDEIIFKDGRVIEVFVDKESIKEGSNNMRYKTSKTNPYIFANLTMINYIKSWNGTLLYPIGVVVNLDTRKIHISNVDHLPEPDKQKKYDTKLMALNDGNEICTACFDGSPIIGDYQLEKDLVRETVMNLQNTNEIMYEHDKLPILQKLVDKILSSWPEKLKGYDYRVQVIRDEQPNAYAVAGGNLYFTTGLINMAESEAELESVLAHEIAHVERRHTLRGYKAYIKKQQMIQGIAVLTGIALALSDNANSQAAAAATVVGSVVATYAIEFAKMGFDRDLEQEADMFAQIYMKKNMQSLKPQINAVDKLAVRTKTRRGYVPFANAYSSHPDLTSRLFQIKNADLYEFENPLSMKFHAMEKDLKLEPGFLDMNINYLYWAPSSNISKDTEISLVGTIINNHDELSFQIEKIMLNFLGTLGTVNLEGIVDVLIPYSSSSEFVARIQSPPEKALAVIEGIKKKKVIPFGVETSAIVMRPGKPNQGVLGMKNMKCSMTIN